MAGRQGLAVSAKPIHIGCSGWNYRDWRGRLYPEGLPASRWLERYAEVFDTVEVNNTFYRLPTRKATAAWAEKTPPGFVFTIKASRYLTHIKRLAPAKGGYALLDERIEPVADAGKLGPILWQLPPNFQRDEGRLEEALERLPRGGRHAFEFRHETWFCEPVYDLLREHRAALVIGDDPERGFQTRELTADWTLVRFHRGSRGRRGNYSEKELEAWAERIAGWRERVEVFAYFNNDWEGFAPNNARRLEKLLGDG